MTTAKLKSGFTLVELLVVIAIIGVLVGITIPAVQMVRESARKTSCLNNLGQIGKAVYQYSASYERLPPGSSPEMLYYDGTNYKPAGFGFSTNVYLLPMLSQQSLYRAPVCEDIRFAISRATQFTTESQAFDHLVELSQNRLPVFLCPSAGRDEESASNDTGGFTSSYVACGGPCRVPDYRYWFHTDFGFIGVHGAFSPQVTGPTLSVVSFNNSPGKTLSFDQFGDGTTQTVLCFESSGRLTNSRSGWAFGAEQRHNAPTGTHNSKIIKKPINVKIERLQRLNNQPFSSSHPGGAQCLMADGSARFMPDSTELDIIFSLASVGGETTSAFNQ